METPSVSSSSGGTFFLMLALLWIFFSGTPDLADCIMFKLLEGHPEKQEIVWSKVLKTLKNEKAW